MSAYVFRPWKEGDDLELLQLWPDAMDTAAATFRAMLGVDADTEPWRRTVVAEYYGVAIAAGTIYETSLHNQHLWSYVEVAPDHRRHGVGSQLLRKLEELAQEAPSGVRSLRSKVETGSVAADFALENGFTKIQRSRVVRIEAGSVPAVPLRENTDGEPTQVVEDLATGSIELTQKLWDFYRVSHEWDPPADISLGRVNRLFLSDEAEAFGAVVLRDRIQEARRAGKKGDIKAFAVSYRPLGQDMPGFELDDDAATEVLLGYDFEFPQAREAIMQLLCLLAAQYPVTIEVGESMEDLTVLVDQLMKMGSASVVEDTLVVAQLAE